MPGVLTEIPGLYTPAECRALIALAESVGFAPAPIDPDFHGPQGFQAREGRDNHRAALHDEAIAAAIWTRARRHVPAALQGRTALGLNERLRFYRYDKGQSFAAHTDGYHRRDDGAQSLLTFMLYLNDGFEGGETVFEATAQSVRPVTGTALVFAHQLWHAGRPITQGRKYVLRTDVMYA